MWYWDFIPAGHSYKKPVSKKDLKRMQENYQKADEIVKEVREYEKEEQKKASQEMDDLLDSLD